MFTIIVLIFYIGILYENEDTNMCKNIYIKSKGIYQPENLMSHGSSRHDDAAQTK